MKKLDETTMRNELRGSAFFSRPRSESSGAKEASLAEVTDARTLVNGKAKDTGPMGPRAQEPLAPGALTSDELIEEIRKVVRQPGKDEGTFRFTTEEKRGLTGIVYEYAQASVRTSQSEITRIAINWLLADYRVAGKTSVLARVLAKLNE